VDNSSGTHVQSASLDTGLTTWRAGPARQAIVDFVAHACNEVPADERVAVFNNDRTLWCEKPMPIQLDFILRRLVEMAQADPPSCCSSTTGRSGSATRSSAPAGSG
jgi:hypothetical protein